MLNDFLKLFDFTQDEIQREAPRFARAFEICGITDIDIERGIRRLDEYFEMKLKGVRGVLAATLLAFNSHILAKEDGAEKIVYGEWPLPPQIMSAACNVAPPTVFLGAPTQLINVVLGQVFGKVAPITSAGEGCGQPAGNAHCALYQTFLGAIELGIIPKPDLLLASGFWCDPPSEAAEILHSLYGIPILYCDGNADSPWNYWPKAWERQVRYFGYQIEKMVDDLGDFIGVEISDEAKRKTIKANAALVYNQQKISNILAVADPQPISHVSAALGNWLYNIPLSPEVHARAVNGLATLVDEIEERVKKGKGIGEKGAPRVYFSIAGLTDPSIISMVEQTGMNVTNIFFQLYPPRALYRTEYKGFGHKVAMSYQKGGPFVGSFGLIEFVKDYVNMCNLDGVIYSFSYSCKGYSTPAQMVKKDVEKEFGIPTLVLEGDIYDSRNYSAEQMRTRVETFAEILREAKRAAA